MDAACQRPYSIGGSRPRHRIWKIHQAVYSAASASEYHPFSTGPSAHDTAYFIFRAHLLIYPSLGEGFGLPVLEGIASHIPVITSDRSSMPEAGGDIANYFDPSQPEQLASMIRQSPFGDANSKVPTARTIHLEKFNRNKIALQYLDEVYRPLSR